MPSQWELVDGWAKIPNPKASLNLWFGVGTVAPQTWCGISDWLGTTGGTPGRPGPLRSGVGHPDPPGLLYDLVDVLCTHGTKTCYLQGRLLH